MKSHRENLKIVMEVIAFGLLFLSVSTVSNPLLSCLFIGIWVVFSLSKLYSKFQYRRGSAEYLLFPMQNDEYLKMTSISLGLIVLILSIAGILWVNWLNLYSLIGFPIGILGFLNGVFDVPKGMMLVRNGDIGISGLNSPMDIRKIKELRIYAERIVLTDINDNMYRVDYLNLDQAAARSIEEYLLHKINHSNFKIVNCT